MAIITRPQNTDYDKGFDETFGKRCFYCKQPLNKENYTEWEMGHHPNCDVTKEVDINA